MCWAPASFATAATSGRGSHSTTRAAPARRADTADTPQRRCGGYSDLHMLGPHDMIKAIPNGPNESTSMVPLPPSTKTFADCFPASSRWSSCDVQASSWPRGPPGAGSSPHPLLPFSGKAVFRADSADVYSTILCGLGPGNGKNMPAAMALVLRNARHLTCPVLLSVPAPLLALEAHQSRTCVSHVPAAC